MIKGPSIRQSTRTEALLEDVVYHIGQPVSSRAFRRDTLEAVNFEWSCGCFGTLPWIGANVAWNQCSAHFGMRGTGLLLPKDPPDAR